MVKNLWTHRFQLLYLQEMNPPENVAESPEADLEEEPSDEEMVIMVCKTADKNSPFYMQ
jgi:hypothetical protein